jgi:hypothetical protein
MKEKEKILVKISIIGSPLLPKIERVTSPH